MASNTDPLNNYTNQTNISPPEVFYPCNNPRNVISPRVAEMVDLVMYAGIFPVLVTWGVITNVINMAVFVRQGLADRINLCLFSLAVSDTGYLLFLMASKSYALVSLIDPMSGIFWLQFHHSATLASCLGFLVISNFTTAVIAVERWLCVTSPLKAARIFKTKYTGTLIVTVAVYVLTLLNISFPLQYHTVKVTDPSTNSSTYTIRLSPFYLRHQTIVEIIDNYMILISFPFFSTIIVIVCTAVIIVRLKVASTWRRETVTDMTSVEKQEVKVTKMLVTVCCVYVTCMTPTVIRQLVLFVGVPGFFVSGHLCNTFKVSVAVSHLLESVNASCNFFIYIRQSSRYKSTLQTTFPGLSKLLWKKGEHN